MTSARAVLRYLNRPESLVGMFVDLACCAAIIALVFAFALGWIA